MQGIDIAAVPAAEDVLGLWGDTPKRVAVGYLTGPREAMKLYATILGVGADLNVALGY